MAKKLARPDSLGSKRRVTALNPIAQPNKYEIPSKVNTFLLGDKTPISLFHTCSSSNTIEDMKNPSTCSSKCRIHNTHE